MVKRNEKLRNWFLGNTKVVKIRRFFVRVFIPDCFASEFVDFEEMTWIEGRIVDKRPVEWDGCRFEAFLWKKSSLNF